MPDFIYFSGCHIIFDLTERLFSTGTRVALKIACVSGHSLAAKAPAPLRTRNISVLLDLANHATTKRRSVP